MTTAKIICDSISESGIRITTMELCFERFLLSQFNTHRMFSRSAQSSRAVPTQRMLQSLARNNDVPVFRRPQAGMQAGEVVNDATRIIATNVWNLAKQSAIHCANDLKIQGVAKEITNRLLEPFSTVKVVVTATEWQNFFDLRLHHAAQPEFQSLAKAMKTAMDESTPRELEHDDWHLPYVSHEELIVDVELHEYRLLSAARCARVSYLNHDNSTPDIEKDLVLARQLLADKHLSPFEHQAKPMSEFELLKEATSGSSLAGSGVTHIDTKNTLWSGNFKLWIQHRHLIGAE